MQTIRDLARLRLARKGLEGPVALVPTMGALHAGHMRLVEVAARQANHVIVSIFVNPIQFGAHEDLSRYPRREAEDAAMLAQAGVAILWAPDVATMYPDGFATSVSVAGISKGLCGASRPGHFDGVATVVAKLFGQVRPDIAVFGEKDWQQLAVVKRMTVDLDLGIEIIGVPTDREEDGLARSSRNAYLSDEERSRVVVLPRTLDAMAAALAGGGAVDRVKAAAIQTLTAAGFRVDYVEIVDSELRPVVAHAQADRIIAAAWMGQTRLIDNRIAENLPNS